MSDPVPDIWVKQPEVSIYIHKQQFCTDTLGSPGSRAKVGRGWEGSDDHDGNRTNNSPQLTLAVLSVPESSSVYLMLPSPSKTKGFGIALFHT